MTPAQPARIHLLPAKAAPYVVVLRRKPSKRFHVIRWNTRQDDLEYGSWFRGKLYANRCDVSFDGRWMVYLAMGSSGDTWNGLCHPPFLKTVAEAPNMGTWFGGGYWSDARTLILNQWEIAKGAVSFRTQTLRPEFGGEDLSVLYPRWARDGWVRRGPDYGTDRVVPDAKKYMVERVGDEGWEHRPTRQHPALTVRYVGYLTHGYTFRYALEGHPDLIDNEVDSACWDSLGHLVFSRRGVLFKYALDDLKKGKPGSTFDLEPLAPPEE